MIMMGYELLIWNYDSEIKKNLLLQCDMWSNIGMY